MPVSLGEFVADFAQGLKLADREAPRAGNVRTGVHFQPGIGPHSEAEAIKLVLAKLRSLDSARYGFSRVGVPYPRAPKQKCDLVTGEGPQSFAVELKLLRLLGDNGKPNDNMLMHILSPYPAHRSAITDCQKLLASGFEQRRAIAVFGYESTDYPMNVAIAAFESLAKGTCRLGPRAEAEASNLIHPVHSSAKVFAWELLGPAAAVE